MTGVGSSPKGMDAFIRDQKRRTTALERRQNILAERLSGGGVQVTNWNDAIEAGFYWSDASASNRPVGSSFLSGVVYQNNMPGFFRIVQDVTIPGTNRTNIDFRRIGFYNAVDGPLLWSAWSRTDGVIIPTGWIGAAFNVNTGLFNITPGVKSVTFNCVNEDRFNKWRVDYYYYCTGADGSYMRLRNNGVDVTATEYRRQGLYGIGASPGAGFVTSDRFPVAVTSGNVHHGWFEIGNIPSSALVRQKTIEGVDNTSVSGDSLVHYSGWLGANDAGRITGFTFGLSTPLAAGIDNGWFSVRGIA